MIIALAFVIFAGTQAPPGAIAIQAGETAPHDGVLITPERAAQIVEEEAQLAALQQQLEAEKHVAEAVDSYWRQKYAEQSKRDHQWYDDPEVNRWGGLAIGFLLGVGAFYGGTYLAQAAGGHP